MADPNDNGKMDQGQEMEMELNPENILHQVAVVMTKDGRTALLGPIDNLPLCLHLLSLGIDTVGALVQKALPKRIIPVSAPLPPGTIPFGRAGG